MIYRFDAMRCVAKVKGNGFAFETTARAINFAFKVLSHLWVTISWHNLLIIVHSSSLDSSKTQAQAQQQQ